jgi:hypothetical protein
MSAYARKVVGELEEQIARLEASVEYYRNRAGEGPEGANVFADAYAEGGGRPVGLDSDITFRRGNSVYRVYLDDLGLHVYSAAGRSSIAVYPQATNSVIIRDNQA